MRTRGKNREYLALSGRKPRIKATFRSIKVVPLLEPVCTSYVWNGIMWKASGRTFSSFCQARFLWQLEQAGICLGFILLSLYPFLSLDSLQCRLTFCAFAASSISACFWFASTSASWGNLPDSYNYWIPTRFPEIVSDDFLVFHARSLESVQETALTAWL